MAITAQEIADFKNAIKEVTDNFFGIDAFYYRFVGNNNTFGEELEREEQLYLVKAFKVIKDDAQGKNKIGQSGITDEAEGYILFNVEDLELVGLWSLGQFLGKNTDRIEFEGQKFRIIGINELGQFVNKQTLLKIQIKRII